MPNIENRGRSGLNPFCTFDELWYIVGTNTLHNENGPACIYANGTKEWWNNGKIHRLDGPACIYTTHSDWWFNGQYVPVKSQKEFERWLKLKAFF